MKTIGFANQYYTLWEVGEPYEVWHDKYSFSIKVDCLYLQNLSMDLEQAKAKVTGDYVIDLDLRGQTQFTKTLSDGTTLGFEQFTFGKLRGEFFNNSTDVWQLERAMNSEPNKRNRVHARRRLIELGEVTIGTPETLSLRESMFTTGSSKYLTSSMRKALDAKLNAAKAGHHETDGTRVKLNIRETKCFGYETQYGYCYIVLYADDKGREFKYKGSSPLLDINPDAFTAVMGTVEHSEYNGINETRLKRLKIA